MRFYLHPPAFTKFVKSDFRAYLSGFDSRIFPSKLEVFENEISLRRPMSESCKLNIEWDVSGHGILTLTTCSLKERDQHYNLVLELARGKLFEVRESAATWQQAGMTISEDFRAAEKSAFSHFSLACTQQHDPDICLEESVRAIEKACDAAVLLIHSYTSQRLASQKRLGHESSRLFGCTVDQSLLKGDQQEVFLEHFNTATLPVNWREIESTESNYHWQTVDDLLDFCEKNRLVVRAGPLLDLSSHGLPTWLEPWAKDFQNLPSFVCDFIETAISRYQSRIRVWEVSAFGNTGGAFELGEDHYLAIVARSIEAASRIDSEAQYFIRVASPWGEYLRHGEHRLSPFQFVDAIVRSNLGLAGVILEINAGFADETSFYRDLLSISKLIDLWSLLQIQIHIEIACPSSPDPDPSAKPGHTVERMSADQEWDPQSQKEWMDRLIPLLYSKPGVNGIFITHFHDGYRHRYPNAGMVFQNGDPKPVLLGLGKTLANFQ